MKNFKVFAVMLCIHMVGGKCTENQTTKKITSTQKTEETMIRSFKDNT